MRKFVSVVSAFALAALIGVSSASIAFAKTYKIAWSHYTGWEPWQCIDDVGIMKRWSEKYGVDVKIVLVNDYMESVNAYTAGAFDGVAITNMDALINPAVGGVDTTAVIIGDFSNGNDGAVTKFGKSIRDLRGKEVGLVVGSVSHYLLARGLQMNGMTERDVTVKNMGEGEIAPFFVSDAKASVVTWNPFLMNIRNEPKAEMVFDSSQIPGEIIDMLVVKTDTPDPVKKALVGAWFEMTKLMSGRGTASNEALQCMAASAGGTLAEFKAQLRTTAMFYAPQEAAQFAGSAELKNTMEMVRTFSFDHELYGIGIPSKDVVGIQFPDGSTMGDAKNVKLRFDAKFMKMAAEGVL